MKLSTSSPGARTPSVFARPKNPAFPENDWALASRPSAQAEITVSPEGAVLTNGKIRLSLSNNGKITVYNQKDERILEEDTRKFCALKIEAREFRPIPGGDYHLTARFQSLDPNERVYGMGQYQQPYLNLKGTDLELAHRNSQASVPFMISSLGYGLLWNNPAVGRAVFGKNVTSFEAFSTQALDYWIVAGDTPAELIEAYGSVAGTVPMMPEYGLGFWQCKLRYQTQEELLHVAREYKRQGLPIDVIVIDFFHWPHQGDWKFDPAYWPDPKAMIEELKSMGIQLMVSIWPTVETDSENYEEMLENGYLIRCDRGVDTSFIFLDKKTLPFDATNPEARGYVWAKVKEHYYDAGVRLFWLDEAEPEYNIYDFDNYRYYSGPCLQTGNIYPSCYSQAFYDGMKAAGQTNIVNLVRCAWAGSQKYGALVWSGDIPSTFGSMKNQLAAGLNMGIAGIPWWTTDIGGFYGGDPTNPEFQELFIRWFQWGAFCPVMRLHGDREPRQPQYGTTGGYFCASGADNEVWSYGPEAFEICKKYLRLREEMRDYTRKLMEEAHTKGLPLMRAMFVEFPDDPVCWELEEQYMYGDKYLVAPILNLGQRARKVYLPSGCDWRLSDGSQQIFSGGQWTEVRAPLDTMPVFERVRR